MYRAVRRLCAVLHKRKRGVGLADKNNMINVIDEFDYSTQGGAYNESFRKWRKKKDNAYAYSFEKNQNEIVYVDGRGFIEKSAVEAEKNVLSRIFNKVGLAMLIWIAFDDVICRITVSVLDICGVNIHTNFFSSMIYGGNVEMAAVLIVSALIKMTVPLIFLHCVFKLPRRVEIMHKMNDPKALIGAIAMTFIVCTAVSIPTAYSSETKEFYEIFSGLDADVSVWTQKEFVIYTVFHVIILPIISELFFRGAMFNVLRQFGDLFAVIMTSLIAGMLTQDLRSMPAVILISLVSSFGMLGSGTIFTAIAVNIVYKMYDLTLIIIENDHTSKMPLSRNIFMILALLAGVAMLAVYRKTASDAAKKKIAGYASELSQGMRILHSAKTFPFSAVASLCLLSAVIRAVL